jgi:hypothetical protein
MIVDEIEVPKRGIDRPAKCGWNEATTSVSNDDLPKFDPEPFDVMRWNALEDFKTRIANGRFELRQTESVFKEISSTRMDLKEESVHSPYVLVNGRLAK